MSTKFDRTHEHDIRGQQSISILSSTKGGTYHTWNAKVFANVKNVTTSAPILAHAMNGSAEDNER